MLESSQSTNAETQNISPIIREKLEALERVLENSPGDEETFDLLTQIEELTQEKILNSLSKELFSLEGKTREQIETEIINEALMGKQTSLRGSIDDLLRITCDRLYSITKQTDFKAILEGLHILHIETEQVLLPPDELTSLTPSLESNGEIFERPSFPKLGHLIQLLREHEIFADDLVILSGIVRGNQMRAESYLLIEIPRLKRSVLLCNAYGEASFVYQGILPRAQTWTLTKSQLRGHCGNRLVRISYSDDHIERWKSEMTDALFQTRAASQEDRNIDDILPNQPGKKINVRDQETYRTEILRCYPAPVEWMQIPQSERLKFKVHGKGLNALARIFEARGNPIGTLKEMATLGRIIYGEGYEIIECEFWTPEQWREKILEKCPTPENWMKMNQIEKSKFKIGGKGITKLATIFGVSGKPIATSKDMASLGKMIYGEGYEILENDPWTLEQWKEKILKIHSTPESWMGMTAIEKLKAKFHGKGLSSLASIFKVQGNPIASTKSMASLGKMIYGEGYEILERELWTPEQWKEKILEIYPKPETWMGMTAVEKRKAKVHGKGFIALASIFEVHGDPNSISKDMARLGRIIYGEGYEMIECEFWTREQWRQKILEKCPTPENWMKMNQKEKLKFKIGGKGITKLASIFGVIGDPIDTSKDMASLGRIIYDEGHDVIEYELWTSEQWKEKILELHPTPESWMGMTKNEKLKVKIHGKGLKAISSVFGASGNPVGTSKDMATLGRAIYGNDPIFEKYISSPTEESPES